MVDFDALEKVVLLFWDTPENFNLEATQQKIGTLFQKVFRIDSKTSFESAINSSEFADDQLFICFVHLSHTKSNKGYDDFIDSKILKDYPKLRYYCITSALLGEVHGKNNVVLDVYNYDRFKEKIFSTFIPQSRLEISGKPDVSKPVSHGSAMPQVDYVIVTALEEDEMEKMLPFIEKEGTVQNSKHLIEYGHLKSKKNKRVAYASQLATGMIDAAVLATEMICLFKPKFVIMAGVLAGKPNKVNIGDVIVATKVFTIDKGKTTNGGFQKEIEAQDTDSSHITKIKRQKISIIDKIASSDATRTKRIDIHFGAIACVRQVIDKDGFFAEQIDPVDRKTIGLEMESYGVSRACALANGGQTIPIIIKSVMDNARKKTDHAKTYAAWTSAMVIQHALENDLI